jgi:hypothetical protein
MQCQTAIATLVFVTALASNLVGKDPPATTSSFTIATLQEAIESRTDEWGDAAMSQPDGASFEFFKDLMPPPRWTDAEFRHYPIVLSAPRSPHKARLISSGGAINARANKKPMWYEQGVPLSFFVGQAGESFGNDLTRLETPAYLNGYLPVVTIKYQQSGVAYRQEWFAPVDEASAAHGVAFTRFSLAATAGDAVTNSSGQVEARIDSPTPLRVQDSEVLNGNGDSIVAFTPGWRWVAERNALVAQLDRGKSVELAVFTRPSEPGTELTSSLYDERRRQCIVAWQDILSRSIDIQTPEKIVNDAWRAMLIGNFMIAVDNRPHYSAGNAYAKLYQGESGDTLRSFLLYGYRELGSQMLKPMLEFDRPDTRFHVAGHKLQLLAYYYWMTRDADTVRAYGPIWRPWIERILANRERESGLLPKDRYAGDIAENVYSLNSNANCWRGLRDVAAVLEEMGETRESRRLQKVAAAYRKAIVDAVARSERLDARPPFIPNALLADEPAHDPLTATRTGSYYDLMCPYIIGSEVFGQGSNREDWLIGYMQQHGGIAMGMPRVRPAQGQYAGHHGTNPLYGLRYQLALLRRDEREEAIVGFYGQLAQGMTRGTFIGGEGNRWTHGDANGRSFYLPPNSTSNATWLITLRNLLVQDWDLDEDARPDTLRLLFAVPRRWLADGKQIRIAGAPTAFGRVSCEAASNLSEGYIEVRVDPPQIPPRKMLLRAPLPSGWKAQSVEIDGQQVQLTNGDTVDLTGRTKAITVRFNVRSS